MLLQIFANVFAAMCLVSVLVQSVTLCRSLQKGEVTVLPADWPPQRRGRFYRARAALYVIGPVSWLTWILFLIQQRPRWSHGMPDTDGAVFLGVLAAHIDTWLRAISPGDYAKAGNPVIRWSLVTSAGAVIIGMAAVSLLLLANLSG
jgi:hypothetical protein